MTGRARSTRTAAASFAAAKREKLEEEHLFVPTPSKKLPMAELSSIVERLATKSG